MRAAEGTTTSSSRIGWSRAGNSLIWPRGFCNYPVQSGAAAARDGAYLHYFCATPANPNGLAETEPLRISFYKAVAKFVRAYSDIAQNLSEAGYSAAEIAAPAKGS